MLQRVLLIILAFAAAAIAAVVVFALLAFVTGRAGMNDLQYFVEMISIAMARAPRLVAKLVLASGFAVVPLIGALLLFEALKLRAWIWYGIAAVVLALAANMIFDLSFDRIITPSPQVPRLLLAPTALTVLSVVAALAGSMVYWLVAGRNAGAWRP